MHPVKHLLKKREHIPPADITGIRINLRSRLFAGQKITVFVIQATQRARFAGVQKAQDTARQGRRDRNGRCKPAVDVATVGWKPAAPKGPGRDSAAAPVRSMTAPVPVREVARSENGNGQKTENGRIRMDYMRLSGKPRQQGG